MKSSKNSWVIKHSIINIHAEKNVAHCNTFFLLNLSIALPNTAPPRAMEILPINKKLLKNTLDLIMELICKLNTKVKIPTENERRDVEII